MESKDYITQFGELEVGKYYELTFDERHLFGDKFWIQYIKGRQGEDYIYDEYLFQDGSLNYQSKDMVTDLSVFTSDMRTTVSWHYREVTLEYLLELIVS